MFESTANQRTRDAMRAAHEERGRFLADAVRYLFSRPASR